MRKSTALVFAILLVTGLAGVAGAHCEVPCGIYDDDMRFAAIAEHITTIEKAVTQITDLVAQPPSVMTANQLTRWVMVKESHADQIRDIVTQYFLTQKIAVPAAADDQATAAYTAQLMAAHRVMRAVMKCKQRVDPNQVELLRQAAADFKQAYSSAQSR